MLTDDKRIFIGSAQGRDICLEPKMGNRHGLVAGATGTGKTVTLQNLAEGFSALGVPVFLTDVKGDLAGLSQPGTPSGSISGRIDDLHLRDKGYLNQAYPVCFWDVFAEQGHPLRATVSDLGPVLLSRLLALNEVQSGVLHIIFRIADDQGLLLLDLKDLRSMVNYVGENAADYRTEYGNVSTASIGAIQRGLLRLEDQGAGSYFGEPSLRLEDLMLTDLQGRGMINILAAERLLNSPQVYAGVLLGLLSDLFERMPEIGDSAQPRLVLMFDEAHLIFADAPAVLLQKIEQVVRLIRSKGVGVFFITQNPADIPNTVLSQLGNRVQHALRAYTPTDQKAVRVAAQSFRANPLIDTEKAISNLAVGEALVSFLDPKGVPQVVEQALILPPESRVGAISQEQRQVLLAQSRLAGRYEQVLDRESAYELLAKHFEERQQAAEAMTQAKEEARQAKEDARQAKELARQQREAEREAKLRAKENPSIIGDLFGDVTKSARRNVTNKIGREISSALVRGVLGGILGGVLGRK